MNIKSLTRNSVAIGLLLPRRPRLALSALAGVVFGVLTVLKIFDMVFYQQLNRPFDPVLDWSNLGPGVSVVRDSIGARETNILLVVVIGALVLLVAVVTASTIWLSTVTARHRRGSARMVTAVGVIWAVSAAASLQLTPAGPGAVHVTPWPFATPAFELTFERRALPKTHWPDDAAFRDAFFAAQPEQATISLEGPQS